MQIYSKVVRFILNEYKCIVNKVQDKVLGHKYYGKGHKTIRFPSKVPKEAKLTQYHRMYTASIFL